MGLPRGEDDDVADPEPDRTGGVLRLQPASSFQKHVERADVPARDAEAPGRGHHRPTQNGRSDPEVTDQPLGGVLAGVAGHGLPHAGLPCQNRDLVRHEVSLRSPTAARLATASLDARPAIPAARSFSGHQFVETMAAPAEDGGSVMVLDVISRYHEALAKRDFDVAREFLKDELRFEGPFESFERADEYVAAIRKLFGIVESIEIRHASADGDQAVALYDMVTSTPAGSQLVCEWYGVEGEQIAWIRAVFDSAPFAFLRGGA
jgi:SnoaL-like domain